MCLGAEVGDGGGCAQARMLMRAGGLGDQYLPSGDKALQHLCHKCPQELEEENKVTRKETRPEGDGGGEMLSAFPEQ